MKYSKTALGLLNAQYRSVLRKCFLINAGLFALGAIAATPANAEQIYTEDVYVNGAKLVVNTSNATQGVIIGGSTGVLNVGPSVDDPTFQVSVDGKVKMNDTTKNNFLTALGISGSGEGVSIEDVRKEANGGTATESTLNTIIDGIADQSASDAITAGLETGGSIKEAINNATSDMATKTWIGEQGYQNATQISATIAEKLGSSDSDEFPADLSIGDSGNIETISIGNPGIDNYTTGLYIDTGENEHDDGSYTGRVIAGYKSDIDGTDVYSDNANGTFLDLDTTGAKMVLNTDNASGNKSVISGDANAKTLDMFVKKATTDDGSTWENVAGVGINGDDGTVSILGNTTVDGTLSSDSLTLPTSENGTATLTGDKINTYDGYAETIAGKADKATTLTGYGITDGANTDLSNITDAGKTVIKDLADGQIDAALAQDGAITEAISTAKDEAIEAAKTDATNKGNQAILIAKRYTDEMATKALDLAKDYTNTYLEAGEEGTYKTVAQSVTDGISTALAENGAIKSAIDTAVGAETQRATAAEEALDGRVDTAEGNISANTQEIARVNGELVNTNAALGETNKNLSNLNTAVKNGFDSLNTEIGNTNTKLNEEVARATAAEQALDKAIGGVAEDLGNVSKFAQSTTGNLSNSKPGEGENATDAATAIANIDATMGQIHGLASTLSEDEGKNNLEQGSTVSGHLTALAGAIGNRNGFDDANYLENNKDIAESLLTLDGALGEVEDSLTDGSLDAKFKSVQTTGNTEVGGVLAVQGHSWLNNTHILENLDVAKTITADAIKVDGKDVATEEYVDNAVAAEETRAKAAEQTLQDNIDAEATAREAAIAAERAHTDENIGILNGLISAETNRAAKVEGELGTAINKETARAQDVEGQLSEAITNTRSEMTANVLALNGMITNETNRATAAEGKLGSAINTIGTGIGGTFDAEGQFTRDQFTSTNNIAADDAIVAAISSLDAGMGKVSTINVAGYTPTTAGNVVDAVNQLNDNFTNGTVAAKFASVESTGQAKVGSLKIGDTDYGISESGIIRGSEFHNANDSFFVTTGGAVTSTNVTANEYHNKDNSFFVTSGGALTASEYHNKDNSFFVTTGGAVTSTNVTANEFHNKDNSFFVTSGGALTASEYHNANNSFFVTTTGDITAHDVNATGNLNVTGTSNLKDTNVDGDLAVTGKATFGAAGSQVVLKNGVVTADKGLVVKEGGADITGDSKVTGKLEVTDDFKVGEKFSVTAADGSMSAAGGNFTVDKSGAITSKSWMSVADGNFKVNSSGGLTTTSWASLADGNFKVNSSGGLTTTSWASLADGKMTVNSEGAITSKSWMSVADGKFTVNSNGDTKAAGTLTADGESKFVKDGENYVLDVKSDAVTANKVIEAKEGVKFGTDTTAMTSVAREAIASKANDANNAIVASAAAVQATRAAIENDNAAVLGGIYKIDDTEKTVSYDATQLVGDGFSAASAGTTANLTQSLKDYAANVETATGGTFADTGVWTGSLTAQVDDGTGTMTDKPVAYGTITANNIMSAVDQIYANIGNTAVTGTNDNVLSANTINQNLDRIDTNIGDIRTFANSTTGNLHNSANPTAATAPKDVATAINNIDATLGKIHGLVASADATTTTTGAAYYGNLAVGTTVEQHIEAVDAAIGDRRDLGSKNEAINAGTKTSVAAGIKAAGDAIGDMDFRGLSYVSEGQDLSGAVKNLDTSLARVEGDLRGLRRDFERGMASMAAMSALVPNPRAYGNTSLSVGTGAYSGHTAMAVGGFHYLTDNIMLNAGVAWGNSHDASYRLGLTWSW
ncbi:MAG: YadA-like family protein [Alphaproteobacteria bacterium]|nr:YadA-like family protein [Alphaproteobacteria bacterium]